MVLILLSAHRLPFSISWAVTMRAPPLFSSVGLHPHLEAELALGHRPASALCGGHQLASSNSRSAARRRLSSQRSRSFCLVASLTVRSPGSTVGRVRIQ